MRYLLIFISLILVTSCSSNKRKEKLAESFVDMRIVPPSILNVKTIENYEIDYQNESTLSDRYNYPNNYVIGVLDKAKRDYKYITYIENLSPLGNFEYVKSILNLFDSDSTQVRVIILENETKLRANIYRKVTNNLEYDFEWAMWKWIKTENGQLKFEAEKIMNKHLFE